MNRHKNPHFGLAIATGILALACCHCSPLSLSESKFHTVRAVSPDGTSAPGVVAPVGTVSSGSNPSERNSTGLSNVRASVREFPAYRGEIENLPSDQTLTLAADLNPEAFDTFKATRSVTVHFGGRPPERCRAFLGLSLSDTAISNFGWNNPVNPITIDCVPQQDGNWKLSVSDSVNQDTWTQVTANLEGLTFFVANNPKMTVVKPTSPQSPRTPPTAVPHPRGR